jgi:hypothetical protein
MQRLLTTHDRHRHRHYGTGGHVWQGRIKAFPIQDDGHLGTVLRYVERNPLRAELSSGPKTGAGRACPTEFGAPPCCGAASPRSATPPG